MILAVGTIVDAFFSSLVQCWAGSGFQRWNSLFLLIGHRLRRSCRSRSFAAGRWQRAGVVHTTLVGPRRSGLGAGQVRRVRRPFGTFLHAIIQQPRVNQGYWDCQSLKGELIVKQNEMNNHTSMKNTWIRNSKKWFQYQRKTRRVLGVTGSLRQEWMAL